MMGLSTNDLYTLLGVVVSFLCIWSLSKDSGQRDMEQRIKAIRERRNALHGEVTGPKKRKRPETSVNFMRAVVMKLQLIKKNQIGQTESSLIEAGLRSKDAVVIYAFFNLVLPIVLGLAGLVVTNLNLITSHKWHSFNYVFPMLGLYMGYKLPGIYIAFVRRKRYHSIQKSLADTLDLMTICAEAGLSLVVMLDRVSRELMTAYPQMAEELGLTSVEIGFLPDRNQALSNLAKRCTLQEVRGIVSVLIQTEKYGTPIAQALRVLSAEFRQARMLRAEQKASALPAKMTFPMIVGTLVPLFIVIIAPAVVNLMKSIH